MVHTVVLTLHIAAGTGGLLLGPVAIAVRKNRLHTKLGLGYQVLVAVLAGTAAVLACFAPARLWPLALIAVATEAAALAGWVVRRRARPGWLPLHIGLMCGSYISFLTAFLVVNWPSPLAWILPTLIGAPLIARTSARAGRAQPQEPATAQQPSTHAN